ncbi:molecular chaperone GrpE [Chitinivorax tropicus]|uniref:Protein GrpE n=1 Tax=Chitinivorax tropicus TaxID=714531 RepID=A0A840MHV9_9PROT|nr:nucleotide exchange factor GrpE [Chitinivorax tropicus]MBB5018238.1 molecular chaperone GrpE [Chitinivorax tropicus]
MQGNQELEPKPDQNNTEAAQTAGAAGQPEVMPSMEEQLRAAELRAEEHHDAWLRAKADAENIRRRSHEEVQSATKYAVTKFATDLLAVKDSLEMALKDNSSIDNIKMGVEMTLKQLASAFEKAQLTEVNPVGERLDPHKHQAISVVPADGEPNTVVSVMQKGYMLADRVIRPAMVVVSKAKE